MNVETEIAALHAKIGEMQQTIDRLEGEPRPSAPTSTHHDERVGRRRLIQVAAGAAAASAAAMVAAPAGRAAAANGDQLIIGNRAGAGAAQVATDVTQLNFTGTEDNGFVVQSGTSFSGESSSFNSALAGWTSRNTNPVGVYGFSNSSVSSGSIGVLGRSDGANGAGVRGIGGLGSADGVVGRASFSSASGVRGEGPVAMRAVGTTTGIIAEGGASGDGVRVSGRDGIISDATRYGVTARGATAPLLIPPAGSAAPSELTDSHVPGEIRVNESTDATTGDAWICVEGGTPGTWRRLAGPSTSGSFVAIAPGRAYDSRRPLPQQGVLVTPANRTISVLERRAGDGTVIPGGLVPLGATAISYNLTLVNTVGRGFVSVEPGTATEAVASAINWTASGQTVANAGIVKVAPDGTIRVFADGPGGSTNFIVDVTGYWL